MKAHESERYSECAIHYVGTCAGEASVGPRNGGSGARSSRPDVLQPRDHQAAALSLYRDIGGA